MTDKKFKQYLRKKHTKTWRVKRAGDGIYYIAGRYARVFPEDFNFKHLLISCEFPTNRFMNARLNKCAAILGEPLNITQQGDTDVTFRIKNQDINKVLSSLKSVLGFYKRRDYSKRKLAGIALKLHLEKQRGDE